MSKEEVEKLYKKLGYEKIGKLYYYDCLICSGFDKERAYGYIDLLNNLWLKDEGNFSISTLSDMLYEVYETNGDEIDKMTTTEILEEIYGGNIPLF